MPGKPVSSRQPTSPNGSQPPQTTSPSAEQCSSTLTAHEVLYPYKKSYFILYVISYRTMFIKIKFHLILYYEKLYHSFHNFINSQDKGIHLKVKFQCPALIYTHSSNPFSNNNKRKIKASSLFKYDINSNIRKKQMTFLGIFCFM